MIIKSSELERILSAAQIKDLSKRAAEHFAKSADFNIYEDSDVEFKVVKLVDKDKNPIYFLVYQKIGTGSFGEVSRAIKLDIEHGTIASNIEVAIKVTDFTQGGTLGKTNITFAKSVTAHENNVLLRIQQSHGYSVGARKKRVPINLGDELVMQEVEIQEAIVAMTLHSGNDIQHMAHKDKFSFGSIRFLELASKFCTDLEQIHNKGVIHSDLKPANVIWDLENGLVNMGAAPY